MRRAPRSSLLLAALLAAAPVHAAPPSKEATTRQQLQQAEKARAAALAAQEAAKARAVAAATKGKRLAIQRDAALAQLRAAEAATLIAADRMSQLDAQRKAAAVRLAKRAEAIRPLLPLMERLSLYPAETLLAVPAGTEDRLRGVMVLQGLAHQLQRQAAALRQDQVSLRQATQAVQAQLPRLKAARAAQQKAAQRLDAQLAQSQATQQQARDEAAAAARRAAALAGKAKTLRAMLARLKQQRRAEKAALAHPTGPGTLAGAKRGKGQLIAPVEGTVVRAWGDTTEAGPAIGISYVAAPKARVVSPCTGRVDFADPFRSYGLLMIVDCGGGYHAVLAGFGRLEHPGGAGGEGGAAGRGDAGLAAGHHDPAEAVCRAAARRQAGEPGAVAQSVRIRRRAVATSGDLS